MTACIESIESSEGGMHAGTTAPPNVVHRLDQLKREIDTISCQLQSSEGGMHAGTAAPPNVTCQLDELKGEIDTINHRLQCEFSESFGQADREVCLDNIVDELQNTVQTLRNAPPPQDECTPWQHWKKEACRILGVNTPQEKCQVTFSCFESSCSYKDRLT